MTAARPPLILLLGGARSGKSRLAEELAGRAGGPVTYLATAEATDPEMEHRIRIHQSRRPPNWRTTEAPIDLPSALAASVAAPGIVIVDCLGVWLGNLLHRGHGEEEIRRRFSQLLASWETRRATCIVVTPEVGLGLIPETPLGRRYRDLLGELNQRVAESADRAYLVVAGRALPLEGGPSL